MLDRHQILLCLFCLIDAKVQNYIKSLKAEVFQYFVPFQLLPRFTEFYFESITIINGTSKMPFYGNSSVKRSGRDHPRIFFEFELTDSFRNFDVRNTSFDNIYDAVTYKTILISNYLQ